MSDLISRKAAIDALGEEPVGETDWDLGCRNQWEWDTEILRTLPSAEPERKWHISFDPYDESTSPKEKGYYRIIEEDGTEKTDYFFGEPRITRHGIGYWATSEKTIIAWARLEWE